jgi:hypothetical protein
MVMAADVYRKLPLDWSLSGKGVGERESMTRLLESLPLENGDVAVMDRGFPSRKLFAALIDKGLDIVARMSASEAVAWKELKPFLKSGKKEDIVHLKLTGIEREIPVRVLERNKRPGPARKGTKKERMVIVTTLANEGPFDRKGIVDIYAARWGVESLFKEMKSFIEAENFHSKSLQGCEQELVASMIWMAIASFLQMEAESTLKGRKVVRADCLRAASDLLLEILMGRPIMEAVADDIDALRQFAYRPKSDRHYARECKRPWGRSIQRGGKR